MSPLRLVAGVLLCSAALARADILPPDVSTCRDKVAGAACQRDDGSTGACAPATCTRNDYSEGPPPKQVAYECLTCQPVAAAPVDAGTPEAPRKSGSCAAVPGLSLAALAAWLARRRR